MDPKAALDWELSLPTRVLTILQIFPRPVRVPTACWLMGDQLDVLDSRVRMILVGLEAEGKVRIDNGGWIHVTRY